MRETGLLLLLAVCLSVGASEPGPGNLLTSSIQFEIVGGRVTNPTLSRAPTRTFAAEEAGAKESLSINPSSDEPSLSYRYETLRRQWSLEFRGASELMLKDQSGDDSVTLEQTPDAPLKLTVQRKDVAKRQFTGRTLWHLLVLQPDAGTHLLPLLEVVNSDWRLAEKTSELKENLLPVSESNWRDQRRVWRRCVEQLADTDFQMRQAAARQLRSGGAVAAAFLQSLDRKTMAAEQIRRISEILRETEPRTDEPAQIAAGWIYDAEAWCYLLRDEDPRYRRAAARHLAELLGRPLNYDPAADASTRTAQVLTIQEGLLRR